MIDANPAQQSAAFDALVAGTLLESALLERHVPLQYVEEYRSKAAILNRRLAESPPPVELVMPVREATLVCPLVGLLVWQKAAQTLSSLESIGYRSAKATALWIGRGTLPDDRVRRVWRSIGLNPNVIGIEEATRLLPTKGAQFQRCGALLGALREQSRLDLESLGEVVLAALCAAEYGRFALQGQDRAGLHNWLSSRLVGERRAREHSPTALFLPRLPWPNVPHILLGDSQRAISEKIIIALNAAPSREHQDSLARGLTEAVARASSAREPVARGSSESIEAIAARLSASIFRCFDGIERPHGRRPRTTSH